MSIVLLDTGVAGGLLASDAKRSQAWAQSITELMAALPPRSRYAIPTPVWFEIAQWNPDWHRKVSTEISKQKNGGMKNPLYEFAGYSIANSVLMDAAWYRHECRGKVNSTDLDNVKPDTNHISFIDSIIAAYSLRFEHFILSINHKDFPPKFFEVLETKVCPRSTNLKREFIHLMKPKSKEWLSTRSS